MSGVSNEHLIIHLHKKVLTALGGSTQKKPATMGELDNLASKVLGGAKILEQFFEQLVAAGVTTGTIMKWAENGELKRRKAKNGWRYHREAVRARARPYWEKPRLHRAIPPNWLHKEQRV